jgi:hypothetical protein
VTPAGWSARCGLLGLAHGPAADVDDPQFVIEEETDGVVLGLSVGVDAGEPAEALAEEVVALGGVEFKDHDSHPATRTVAGGGHQSCSLEPGWKRRFPDSAGPFHRRA